jgi:transposase
MRGEVDPQRGMFSYVDLESRVPASHPIRKIRRVVDKALKTLSPEFDQYYSEFGRVSIPPEMLLRAQFLQIFYSIRSERQLVERIDYDLLFRWFVGMGIDDAVWNHSTFSKNRDRVLSAPIAERLFEEIKKQAYAKRLMSRDHFSVDGTLIDASASMKSFVPKEPPPENPTPPKGGSGGKRSRNADADFKNQKRSNETHHSTTDPDARLFKKSAGSGARLCTMGHIVTENRNGMIVEATVTTAGTSKEWDAGLEMLGKLSRRPGRTVGADKGYDTKRFVQGCRDLNITAHVAARKSRSAVDGRTTATPGYEISQKKRKRVEEPFGWMKDIGSIRTCAYRGLEKTRAMMLLNCTAFNIIRMNAEC